jgi:hypothetical protein
MIATALYDLAFATAHQYIVVDTGSVRGVLQVVSRFDTQVRCTKRAIHLRQITGIAVDDLLEQAQSNTELDLDEVYFEFHYSISF